MTSINLFDIGGNRLSPDGIHDREVGITCVKTRTENQPRALQIIYSMHPTVLHEDSTLVSSDFPGYMRQYVKQHLDGVEVVYHTGTCGNLSPRYHVKEQTFSEAERLGYELGGKILTAVESLTEDDFKDEVCISAASMSIELPFKSISTVMEAETKLQKAVAKHEQLIKDAAGHPAVRTAECEIFGAEENLTLAKADESGQLQTLRKSYHTVELQIIRIGCVYFVALPGEWFVEYGLEIKKLMPEKTFVITLANGELQGYIVTPNASGYEANMSLFKPEAGRIMLDAVAELIKLMIMQ